MAENKTAYEKKLLEESVEQLKDCMDREGPERAKQLQDLRFVALDQWDASVRNQRENDPNGARSCLTIDKINQYRTQIINDIRKNRPAIKVRPVDDDSDPDTAQVFQGIIRHIEDHSSADICYETAAECAIDGGIGYYRFATEYVEGSYDEQEIKVLPLFDPFSVYLGPHIWPDGSDAEYAFIAEDMPKDVFKRKFPKAKTEPRADFPQVDAASPFWIGEDSVRIVEKFWFAWENKKIVRLDDGTSMLREEYDAMPAPQPAEGMMVMPYKPAVVEERDTSVKSVKWAKLSPYEVLDERDWPGSYLPIVKVVGNQKFVDGKKLTWGIVRPAIDSARMYNWWASAITDRLARSPLPPFIGAEGQFEGHENEWAEANKSTRPYLSYKPIDVNGNAIPPPQRQHPAQIEAAMIQQLSIIEHDIQTSLGMFKASVGQEQPNQSGRAIRALQTQSDTATFHFPDNLARSVRHGGRILIDLIPKIYDTARIVRMLGDDGKPTYAKLDPNQQTAVREIKDMAGKVKKIYNLGVGRYDVTVTVGPSYATKRMETVDIMQEAMKSNPALIPIVGDLMFRSIDAPMSDAIADRLHKALPPQFKDDQQGQPQIPPEVGMKFQQMGQAMQMLQQENQQLKQGTAVDMEKLNAQHQIKMESLRLDAAVEQEKARIAREQFEFNKALQIEKAAHDVKMSEEKAAHERGVQAKDQEHAMEMSGMTKTQEMLGALAQALINLDSAIKTQIDLQTQTLSVEKQILAQQVAPKAVSIGSLQRAQDGSIKGGTVTVQ